MTDDTTLDDLRTKHDRNQQQRLEWIDLWAEFVASVDDDTEWGKQLNALIDAQIESARTTTVAPRFDPSMTPHTDTERTPCEPAGTTLGFNWLANLKVRFGAWLEERRQERIDSYHGISIYTGGLPTLANLKVRFGQWLEKRRNREEE